MKKTNISLFLTFFKIGLFTFGGGYAMISFIQEEVVQKKGWLSQEELLEIIAIAEATPGPIAINLATFVGYKKGKLIGSVLSTIGVVLPSLILLFLISLVITPFLANRWIGYAFEGIKCAVAFLILRAAFSMIKDELTNKPEENAKNDSKDKSEDKSDDKSEEKPKNKSKILFFLICFIITLLAFIGFQFFQISFSSLYFILIGGLIGSFSYAVQKWKTKRENKIQKEESK